MATEVEVRRHFSVPVYAALLEAFPTYQATLEESVHELARSSPSRVQSNSGGFHSDTRLHTSRVTAFRWATHALTELAAQCLAPVYARCPGMRMAITELWANVAPAGAWHVPHHHFPSAWSGVLYVRAAHTVGTGLAGERGGCVEFLNPLAIPAAYGSDANALYTPRDGLALLFPGGLQHFTYPHDHPAPRVTLGFNLAVDLQSAPTVVAPGR
jgi:uncharacterized protein (TIGR02466 family)